MPRPASQIRPAPAIAPDAVFLSARVVDHAAFGELAGALRELVERAGAEAQALASAAAKAEESHQRLVDLAPQADARVAAATAALGSLDVRFADAAALIAGASDLADRAAAANAEIEAALKQSREQIVALEARLVSLVERAERAAAAVDEAARRIVRLAPAQHIESKPIAAPAPAAPPARPRRARL
jgi:chromosome segregation ATPase